MKRDECIVTDMELVERLMNTRREQLNSRLKAVHQRITNRPITPLGKRVLTDKQRNDIYGFYFKKKAA